MIFRTIGRLVALLRFVGGSQLTRQVLLVPGRDAIMWRRASLGIRTSMRRFVLGALDLQLVGATLIFSLQQRLAIPVGWMPFRPGMRLAASGLAFLVATLQSVAHLAEQRAE